MKPLHAEALRGAARLRALAGADRAARAERRRRRARQRDARRGVDARAMSAHRSQRLEAFRALRAETEASILPLATSVDGRSFAFQSKLEGLELRLGGYVVLEGDGDGRARPGAVARARRGGRRRGRRWRPTARTRSTSVRGCRCALARGEGVILDGGGTPFNDRLARPATAAGGRRLARARRAEPGAARGRDDVAAPTACPSRSTPAASTATRSSAGSRGRARATRSG